MDVLCRLSYDGTNHLWNYSTFFIFTKKKLIFFTIILYQITESFYTYKLKNKNSIFKKLAKIKQLFKYKRKKF
ncbi:hypothetical protein DR084_01005 [Mycoplasma flocculare]|nr:hypothetical protein [Mesomycoplasma flocculare]